MQRGCLQKFRYTAAHQLLHVRSGLCVDAGGEAGADARAAPCRAGRAAQLWRPDFSEDDGFRGAGESSARPRPRGARAATEAACAQAPRSPSGRGPTPPTPTCSASTSTTRRRRRQLESRKPERREPRSRRARDRRRKVIKRS